MALSRIARRSTAQPAIVALPVPRPYSAERVRAGRPPGRSKSRCPTPSARTSRGWSIRETAGRSSSARPDGRRRWAPLGRHIAILFRRFVSFGEDVTRGYIDAIEARGIPHLLVGGKAFHEREEVETIAPPLRPSNGRTTSCRCSRRSRDRSSRSTTRTCSSSVIASGRSIRSAMPKELGGNTGTELALTGEADHASAADRRRAAAAAAAAPPPELSSGRRYHRPAVDRDARARRLHPAAGRRAGARQRAARRRAGAAVRGRRRHLVSRLHRRAAIGRGRRNGGGAHRWRRAATASV